MSYPVKLKKGDTVGLLASCSHQPYNQRHFVKNAVSFLESWGLKVELQPEFDQKYFYLAGPDKQRSKYFQAFYSDTKIKAIFFTMGGYGASRLFQYLNDDLISQHQKIIVGLSDVTSLLLYIHKICGGIVYYGPNLATNKFLESQLRSKSQESLYNNLFKQNYFPTYKVSTIKPGYGKGYLTGGNLSLVVTTLGTPYEIETKGKVLFLEDVGEKPYRIDRMLTHLFNAGKFDKIQGLVFGDMVGCHGEDNLLWKVIEDIFKDASFPVVHNFPSGHADFCVTIPFGTDVELETNSKELRFVPN